MLTKLHIKNYALIDRLDLEWRSGLTAITGETGAGKSILLGALGLALGDRADRSSLFNQEEKCVIEVEFDLSDRGLQGLFDELELDYADKTIIRRELTPAGKSRSFVNDTPVVLQSLKRIGAQLIDIHGQHDTLNLQHNMYQLGLIDAFAGHSELQEQMKEAYRGWRRVEKELNEAEERRANLLKERDYHQFIWEELENARLEDVDLEGLQDELNRLEHADQIKQNLFAAAQGLSEEDGSIVEKIRRVSDLLSEIKEYGTSYDELFKRLESTRIELVDIASEIVGAEEDIESDPQRKELLEEQMDELNRLLHKHQLNDVDGLIALKNELDLQLRDSDNLDDRIEELKKELSEAELRANDCAEKLRQSRKEAAAQIETKVLAGIHFLSMPAAQFEVQLLDSKISEVGKDKIQFMFTANPGRALKEMEKAASGGELSRIMLAIKKVLSERTTLPTIIFDEIDTGVSGETVSRMADMLQEMSASMQVIAVTHLAQMAAKGKDHMIVRKHLVDNVMNTSISRLNTSERIEEIARLISGEEVTETSRNHAKELMAG